MRLLKCAFAQNTNDNDNYHEWIINQHTARHKHTQNARAKQFQVKLKWIVLGIYRFGIIYTYLKKSILRCSLLIYIRIFFLLILLLKWIDEWIYSTPSYQGDFIFFFFFFLFFFSRHTHTKNTRQQINLNNSSFCLSQQLDCIWYRCENIAPTIIRQRQVTEQERQQERERKNEKLISRIALSFCCNFYVMNFKSTLYGRHQTTTICVRFQRKNSFRTETCAFAITTMTTTTTTTTTKIYNNK